MSKALLPIALFLEETWSCKITLSADYNAAPYIKLSESGLHEKSAELYLPENTEIQYD